MDRKYRVVHYTGLQEDAVDDGLFPSYFEARDAARATLTSKEFRGKVFDGPAEVIEVGTGKVLSRFRGHSDAPGFERIVEDQL
jgi:hypothetical protein